MEETYATRLKTWRELSGLSQSAAARAFEVTVDAYRRWESNRTPPGREGSKTRLEVEKVLRRSLAAREAA